VGAGRAGGAGVRRWKPPRTREQAAGGGRPCPVLHETPRGSPNGAPASAHAGRGSVGGRAPVLPGPVDFSGASNGTLDTASGTRRDGARWNRVGLSGCGTSKRGRTAHGERLHFDLHRGPGEPARRHRGERRGHRVLGRRRAHRGLRVHRQRRGFRARPRHGGADGNDGRRRDDHARPQPVPRRQRPGRLRADRPRAGRRRPQHRAERRRFLDGERRLGGDRPRQRLDRHLRRDTGPGVRRVGGAAVLQHPHHHLPRGRDPRPVDGGARRGGLGGGRGAGVRQLRSDRLLVLHL
ncbi:MAG: hypothetical protein AVDCRST_MAG08-1571, partial [uncultured Acetobacteraceae bacterium]